MTATAASPLGLIEASTAIPIVRPGVVRRDELIKRLESSGGSPVVSVTAPAGYGKTTVLAQWASDDPRRFAWLTVDERDDDPALLLRYVEASLERAAIVGSTRARVTPGAVASVWLTLLPEVCTELSGSDGPYVLVLDDVHRLTSTEALNVLGVLARQIPTGSQLVLSGRTELTSVVARRRAAGHVSELGPADLALSKSEAQGLLEAVGLQLADEAVETLMRRTEGWAAGLYLAAIAQRGTASELEPDTTEVDRFVDDYVRAEHLASLPKRERSFLARSSVLERMRADMCDAVLDRRDSRRMLAAIERSNLFLVPLDEAREWYRYHDLFRGALLHELDRTDPGAAEDLRRRAADWCESHNLPEEAMAYAIASQDIDRMARLLQMLALPLYRSGRMATVEAWLAPFDDASVISRYPAVAVLGGLVHALSGRPFQAERWADAAERGADDPVPLLDGSASARPWVAILEAFLCRRGPERMHDDATRAIAELGPLSPFRAAAMWLHATALLLQDKTADPDARLEEAVGAAEASGATFIGVTAAAQRALLALKRDDLRAARALVARAFAFVRHERFSDYMPMALLLVAEARMHIAGGETAAAARGLAMAQRVRPYLTYAIPFYAVQTLAETARAFLALDDVNGARAALSDATEVLRHRPELGVLSDDVAKLRDRAAAADRPRSGWESSLTAAELRLLPLLTTHLTFREIGELLVVTRNTVKTQGISIYRKLGVTSRSEAVRRAAELGLLESTVGGGAKITHDG